MQVTSSLTRHKRGIHLNSNFSPKPLTDDGKFVSLSVRKKLTFTSKLKENHSEDSITCSTSEETLDEA